MELARRWRLKSCCLTNFSESALWERCVSQWQQCEQTDERLHFSTLLNLDESYKFLR